MNHQVRNGAECAAVHMYATTHSMAAPCLAHRSTDNSCPRVFCICSLSVEPKSEMAGFLPHLYLQGISKVEGSGYDMDPDVLDLQACFRWTRLLSGQSERSVAFILQGWVSQSMANQGFHPSNALRPANTSSCVLLQLCFDHLCSCPTFWCIRKFSSVMLIAFTACHGFGQSRRPGP